MKNKLASENMEKEKKERPRKTYVGEDMMRRWKNPLQLRSTDEVQVVLTAHM